MEKDKNKLDNIKSFYILKEIFNYLSKSVFLDFINFNKTLQGKFEINIEDYKKFGNRTKIIENNGLGKEYKLNTDILIFEGEYLNGKKNGKGKEYYENGQIKFEGEYLNGKIIEGKGYDDKANEFLIIEKNGNGTEYFKNGRIQFEGKYYNGKRWNGIGYNYEGKKEYEIKYGKGYIKEYGYNGQKLYEGNYIDGKRNGKGKEYLSFNESLNLKKEFFQIKHQSLTLGYFKIFEGEYINGERNGNGKEYYENKQVRFEGEYLNGKIWNGKGYDNKGEEVYEIKDGKGYIKEYNYAGELIFEGEYLNGERNGKGKEYGLKITDDFLNRYKTIITFEGEYLNGKRNGKGKEYYEDGKIKFEGEYFKGQRKN